MSAGLWDDLRYLLNMLPAADTDGDPRLGMATVHRGPAILAADAAVTALEVSAHEATSFHCSNVGFIHAPGLGQAYCYNTLQDSRLGRCPVLSYSISCCLLLCCCIDALLLLALTLLVLLSVSSVLLS